jgi:membrane protease YdiL (CAAX protease family)
MDRPEPIEGPGPGEGGALGYPYILPEAEPSLSPEAEPSREEPIEGDRRRSPDTSWRPWMAPVALLAGLVAAAVGGLVVDIPLVVFGVKITSSHTPPGVSILDTVVQDVAFVVVAVYCARAGARAVRSWQFGLRAPGVSWASAGGLVVLLLIVFIVLSAIWSEAVNPGKEKLLEQLGSNEGTLLLVLSAGLTCVVAPICEEFLFRGYIFTALRNWHGTLPAALITGVIFGGVHAGSAPALDLVPLGLLGFGLCLLYRYTGSLYTSIAAHSLNNSLAFSSLEDWSWQIPVLIVGSLLAIAALAWAFKRIGLIESTARPPQPTIYRDAGA